MKFTFQNRSLRLYPFIVVMVLAFTLMGCENAWLLKPLESGVEIPPGYGDVLLVLGGGLRPRLHLGYSTEERLDLAVSLYHQQARTIIISDGSLYKSSPAVPRLLAWLAERGVSPRHVLLEGRSQNTRENLVNCLAMIRETGNEQVIACTSPYHQARVKLIMKQLGYRDFKIARMERSEIRSDTGAGQWFRNVRLILWEYLAILRFHIHSRSI